MNLQLRIISLVHAARVCTKWQHAVELLKRTQELDNNEEGDLVGQLRDARPYLSIDILQHPDRLTSLCRSRMRHHCTRLRLHSTKDVYSRIFFDIAQLDFARCMSHLQSLSLEIVFDPVDNRILLGSSEEAAAFDLCFPPSLRRLHCDFRIDTAAFHHHPDQPFGPHLSEIMVMIVSGCYNTKLEYFSSTLERTNTFVLSLPAVVIESLNQISTLTGIGVENISPRCSDIIRQMCQHTQLRRVDISCFSSTMLRQLIWGSESDQVADENESQPFYVPPIMRCCFDVADSEDYT